MIEDVIKSGVRPDITLIDDAMVAKLVVSYLDSGDRSFYESMSSQAKETCIDTDNTLLRRSFDARCTLIPSPLPTPPPSPPSLRLSNDRNPFVRRPNDPLAHVHPQDYPTASSSTSPSVCIRTHKHSPISRITRSYYATGPAKGLKTKLCENEFDSDIVVFTQTSGTSLQIVRPVSANSPL